MRTFGRLREHIRLESVENGGDTLRGALEHSGGVHVDELAAVGGGPLGVRADVLQRHPLRDALRAKPEAGREGLMIDAPSTVRGNAELMLKGVDATGQC
eukprot:1175843-Prorocentrum_minimum.AAC.4